MSKVASDSNDHWKRLAAELGLEIEPEPAPEAGSETAPEAEAAPRPEHRAERVRPAPVEDEFDRNEPAEVVHEAVPAHAEIATGSIEESDPMPGPDTEGASRPDGDDGEKPRRRGRRRSRRTKVEERTDEAAATTTATADDEDGDSPAEAVRDWNIPSWNDLIASLHRPER